MAKNREPGKLLQSESESEAEASSEEFDSEPELTQKPLSSTPATKPLPQSAEEEEEEDESESESESDTDGPTQNVPPVATKSIPQSAEEEEEESESESESESNSDGANQKAPSIAAKSIPQSAEEEEESESESGSESESDSDAPLQKAPPVATKSVQDVLKSSAGATNPRSSPVADPATPSQSPAGKGPAKEKETDADASDPETSVKKPYIQRIWSEEDEIVLLEGMIDYATKIRDPVADWSAFYDYIKKDLDFADVTKAQLLAKMKRLRQKYNNNKSKERILRQPHEQNAYKLSNTLWGNENVKENGSEKVTGSPSSSLGKRANSVENEDTDKVTSLPAVKDDLESALPAKRAKFVSDDIILEGKKAEEWNKLKKLEYDAYMRHLDVKSRQIKFVMDRSKP